MRRLGIGPDVELGRRRHVPLGDRAAHEHDPLDVLRPVGFEVQRDVRERADRHEHGARANPAGDEVDRRSVDGLRGRLRQSGAVEAAVAVHVRRDLELAQQRLVCAARDRDVGAAHELEHAEGVLGRLVERLVPVDGRDAEQLDLGAREREEERDRVVVARDRSRG